MVSAEGIEPPTFCVSNRCSARLSYAEEVGRQRIELWTFRLKVGSSATELAALGALGRNRTADLSLRRRLLYPLSYEGMVRQDSTSYGCSPRLRSGIRIGTPLSP